MYKIYNDEDILVAESKKELDHSIITLLEGCGYRIVLRQYYTK